MQRLWHIERSLILTAWSVPLALSRSTKLQFPSDQEKIVVCELDVIISK